MLSSCRETCDILLDQVDYDVSDHIQEFHHEIIYALQRAAKLTNPYTKLVDDEEMAVLIPF